ncbi:MAG: alpha/beta hydrolase [Alphaproteobacteria bacterium]|nr:alpha/beta hydrolase [Alphaproteobacteria bacterium]
MKNNYLSILKNIFLSLLYQRSYQATIVENLLQETCDRKLKDLPKCKNLVEEMAHIQLPDKYDLSAYHSSPNQFKYKDISVVTFGNKDQAKQLIFFVHGGGWLFDLDPVHFQFCDKLAKDLNAFVVVPAYLLAPQYTFSQSISTLVDLYAELLKDFKQPFSMVGDSAGGQIILSLVMMFSEKQIKLPNQIIAISPVVDASMSINPRMYAKYEKLDPILGTDCIRFIAEKFVSDFELTDYRISPYFFDKCETLPPVTLIVGTREIFYPDVCSFYKKLRSAGVQSKLIIGTGLNHDFVIYHDIPESKKVFLQICDILRV